MPTTLLNRKAVNAAVGRIVSDSEIEEKVSMMGVVLENLTKEDMEIEVFANRPDLLSEQGFGRAYALFTEHAKSIKKYSAKKSTYEVVIDPSVKAIRPFAACAVVKGVHFSDEKIKEIINLQEKLHVTHGRKRKKCAIGVYPLDAISFPVKYTAQKPKDIVFRPLGANKAMDAATIVNIHPTAKEYAHLLEGHSHYPLFIDARDQVMSLVPLINSETTGRVTEKTKDVFVECTGTDLETLKVALTILVTTLADMGGTIHEVQAKYPDKKTHVMPDLAEQTMKLDLRYAQKRLGIELSEADARKLLRKMGIDYESGTAHVPPYRADIMHPVDLVEDIAIAYGFDNFVAQIPNVSTVAKEDPRSVLAAKLREIVIGLGGEEVVNYHLLSPEELSTQMLSHESFVTLESGGHEYSAIRNSLVPTLLKTLAQNQHNEYPQRIFEIGSVAFLSEKTETGVLEVPHLGIALCHAKVTATEGKQWVESILGRLGLAATVRAEDHVSFIPGRCAGLYLGHKKIGLLGEIHPEVLTNFGLPVPVTAAEIDLVLVREIMKEESKKVK